MGHGRLHAGAIDGGRALLLGHVGSELERGEARPRVPARCGDDLVEGVGGEGEGARKAALVGGAAADDLAEVVVGQALELDDARAREQGPVHFEVGVFGRGAHEDDRAVFDRVEQGVLLAAIEAVDLVDEENRPRAVRAQARFGRLDLAAQVGHRASDSRHLDEGRLGGFGDDVGDARLAGARGPVEDHRRQTVVGDRRSEPAARPHGLLLALELVQAARAHAHRERRVGVDRLLFHFGEKVVHAAPSNAVQRSIIRLPKDKGPSVTYLYVKTFLSKTPSLYFHLLRS
jgi:hypothetical protein